MLKTYPFFWYQKKLSPFLFPLWCGLWICSLFYRMCVFLKSLGTFPLKLKIPVICVGNISLGGTGKTPVCLALSDLIKKNNPSLFPEFLSRGYKGSFKGPLVVDPMRHKSHEVGDEPLLLSKKSKTWISFFRERGALKAQEQGASLLILDDGFQNQSLIKDFSFLVVDGGFGFGNRHIFPLGPLREPLKNALMRAQALILIGEDSYAVESFVRDKAPRLPIIRAILKPSCDATISLKGKKVVAFAGIGFPDKFLQTLKEMEVNVCEFISFSDHYTYTKQDFIKLQNKADFYGAALVTTEKDFVRLPNSFSKNIYSVPITLEFENPNLVISLLRETLNVSL